MFNQKPIRIQIIGYSGSGKSTLAKILSQYLNINVLYLDNVQFYGDWQERSLLEKNNIVHDFLNKNDSWVIDGNYSNVAPQRFDLANITIFLNYNRFYCYRQCKKRYKMNLNMSRESCPCIKKFDLEFKKWILINGRTRKNKQQHLQNLNKTKGIKLIFKNRRQLKKWLIENNIQM